MKTETFATVFENDSDSKEQGRAGKGIIVQAIEHIGKNANYRIEYLENDKIVDKAYKNYQKWCVANNVIFQEPGNSGIDIKIIDKDHAEVTFTNRNTTDKEPLYRSKVKTFKKVRINKESK